MATKLRSYDFTEPSTLTSSSKATYPWDQWFDGDIWQLRQDEDFHTHPLMMERIIRTRAAGRGAKVQIRHVACNGDDPFGLIVLERTDIVGPEQGKRMEASAKRQAKREAAKADAQATLSKAGIKPVSKRPVKKLPARVKQPA